MRIYFVNTDTSDWLSVLVDFFLVHIYRDRSNLNHIVIALDGVVYDLTIKGCYSYNESDLNFSRVRYFVDIDLCLTSDLAIKPLTLWSFARWFFGLKPRVCTSLVEMVTGYTVGSLSPFRLLQFLENKGYEKEIYSPRNLSELSF